MFVLNSIIHAHHNEHLNITYEKVNQYELKPSKVSYDSGFSNVWPNFVTVSLVIFLSEPRE